MGPRMYQLSWPSTGVPPVRLQAAMTVAGTVSSDAVVVGDLPVVEAVGGLSVVEVVGGVVVEVVVEAVVEVVVDEVTA